jgi:hypothetical protein
MSLTTIRTKIKTYIQTATGLVSSVYDYRRISSDIKQRHSLFKENEMIHTWDITRVGFERQHGAGHGGVVTITHDFLIRGFYGLNDTLATEKTFADIVDLVCVQFENNPTLDGEAQIINNPIVGTQSEEMFASVLCHKAEIKLLIQQRRTF